VATLLEKDRVVRPVDVLVEMQLLKREHLEDWRFGRAPYLEPVINCNLSRLSALLRVLRFHAHELNLKPLFTVYNRWGKGPKHRLRFSKTGDPNLENAYATHLVSPDIKAFAGGRTDAPESAAQGRDEPWPLSPRAFDRSTLKACNPPRNSREWAMAEPVCRSWTLEEFFAWQEDQADRCELVDGRPLKMRAGGRNVHDDIVVNLVGELREQLRGSGCRPFTGDGSVETRPGQIRRPDVGVDCGSRDPNGMQAALPTIVVEVLSPSTRDFDSFRKLEEYKGVASVEYILLVEPNAAFVSVWSRDGNGQWGEQRVQGLAGAVEMPKLKIALRMEGIYEYEGVAFPVLPRRVPSEEDNGAVG